MSKFIEVTHANAKKISPVYVNVNQIISFERSADDQFTVLVVNEHVLDGAAAVSRHHSVEQTPAQLLNRIEACTND